MRSLGSTQCAASSRVEDVNSLIDLHCGCYACGHGEDGLGLVFGVDDVDTVSAEWYCDEKYQSYPGILHGGIIATILDCAMTNCLLIKDVSAVTADMHIEFQEPVRVGRAVTVRASLVRSRSPLFILDAEMIQNGVVCARSRAKFMIKDVWSDTTYV